MTTRPFRFVAAMPPLRESAAAWKDEVRRIEDLGYSSVAVSDHFTLGAVLEPFVAMSAAASATERLRVVSMVLGNDYRHPVLLHRSAALLDVLSAGRLELGLGAGWMLTDYRSAGIPYDPPGTRVSRLAESVRVIKGLFGDAPFSMTGEHYTFRGLDGLPKPAQRPHPPILIGGGGRRILSLAGREADIASINPNHSAGEATNETALDMTAERVAEKAQWVRSAAAAAGRPANTPELQLTIFLLRVTDSRREAEAAIDSLAALFRVQPADVLRSPAVLVGSLRQCCETLLERRERYGLSYIGFGPNAVEGAPLVDQLSGR